MTTLRKLQALSSAAFLAMAIVLPGGTRADIVHLDDVIIDGSLCVGYHCAANMYFGFDTIILRQNNLRILFDDTTSSGSFPRNDWRLIANDTRNGGGDFFAIEDATAGRQIFKVEAGARSNSIFVSDNNKVGFGTSTPALPLHVAFGDTPSLRLQQDGSSGWPPQTWDVAGNEVNFFVRDATNGSLLPFRIRRGAPTNSMDIAASGNIGLGVENAPAKLTVQGPSDVSQVRIMRDDTAGASLMSFSASGDLYSVANGYFDGTNWQRFNTSSSFWLTSLSPSSDVMRIQRAPAGANPVTAFPTLMTIAGTGNVGIGVAGPSAQLHTAGTVRFEGLPNCSAGIQTSAFGDLSCITSSLQYKHIAGDLPSDVALANVMALRPQVGSYKKSPDVPEHWLIAEDVARVDPALAGFADGKPYTVKTQNVVADLVAVVQHQQRQALAQRRQLLVQQERIERLERALAERTKSARSTE